MNPWPPACKAGALPLSYTPTALRARKRNAPIDYSKGRLDGWKDLSLVSAALSALHGGNLFQVEAVLLDDRIRQKLVAYPRRNVLSPCAIGLVDPDFQVFAHSDVVHRIKAQLPEATQDSLALWIVDPGLECYVYLCQVHLQVAQPSGRPRRLCPGYLITPLLVQGAPRPGNSGLNVPA